MRSLSALVAVFLSITVSAVAAPPPEPIDDLRLPVVSPGVAPPLAPELNCAVTYTEHDFGSNWYDTSDGWEVDDWDDQEVRRVYLPFAFEYYGVRYETIAIAADGYASFVDPDTLTGPFGHDPIPDPSSPRGVLAVFWKDLDPTTGTSTPHKDIEFQTFGSAPNRALAITWAEVPEFGQAATSHTFQLVLFETTNYIRFQYLSMIGDRSLMSIGIEDPVGSVGIEIYSDLRGNPRTQNLDGKAFEFRPNNPAITACNAATVISCPGVTLTNQMLSGAGTHDRYGCGLGTHDAGEKLYRLNVTGAQRIDLKITPDDPLKDMRAYVMTGCRLCRCLEGDTATINAALGAGTYYIAVDGETAADNGPFTLELTCKTLLGGTPNGNQMAVGTSAACGDIVLDFDRFADGRGVWNRQGWTRSRSDRNYEAIRIDGLITYTTNPDRSSCRPFERINFWVDPNAKQAVSYWRMLGADVIQTVNSEVVDLPLGGKCCGVKVTTEVRNLDTVPHFYEYRTLKSIEHEAGTQLCIGLSDVTGGPMEVSGMDYFVEQDLTCGTLTGLCGAGCTTSPLIKSADDLSVAFIPQVFGSTAADSVRAEYVKYGDVNRVCDMVGTPDAWIGGWDFPTPGFRDALSRCQDDAALVYLWRLPRGTAIDCAVPANCVAPGASIRTVMRYGDACTLDPYCNNCLATSKLTYEGTEFCVGVPTVIDATDSELVGCSGTISYAWFRDGILTATTTPQYLVDEPVTEAGTHTYTVQVACNPPPGGVPCADTASLDINSIDCSLCSITPDLTPSAAQGCLMGNPIVLDSSLSIITACPGTVRYEWKREGVVVPGEELPQLSVIETVAGTYNYEVSIFCDPPPQFPPGASCLGSSTIPIEWVASCCGTQAPADTGNTLLAVKVAASSDISIDWSMVAMDPARDTFNLLRGLGKLDLCELVGCTGPPAVHLPTLVLPTTIDSGALSTPDNYFYRVQGVSCVGVAGPY